MGREPGDERGSDQAIWRDLVARLERPVADEHAVMPWPDSENLGHASLGLAGPADTRQNADPSKSTASQPDDSADLTPGASLDSTTEQGPGADGSGSRPGTRTPANRGRVIRPASFMRFTDQPGKPTEPGREDAGHWEADEYQDHDHPSAAERPADRQSRANGETNAGDTEPETEGTGFADVEPWRPSARNLSAEEYLNLADLSYLDYDTGDQDDRYVPPLLPPQPKLDPVAKGAWTALLGGPGYLLLALLLGWQVPGWAQLAAIIAFMGGFLVLVVRLGDGPSRRDGPDQGAVV